MMKHYLLMTGIDGNRLAVDLDHIIRFGALDSGTMIYTDGHGPQPQFMVTESFDDVMKRIEQFYR